MNHAKKPATLCRFLADLRATDAWESTPVGWAPPTGHGPVRWAVPTPRPGTATCRLHGGARKNAMNEPINPTVLRHLRLAFEPKSKQCLTLVELCSAPKISLPVCNACDFPPARVKSGRPRGDHENGPTAPSAISAGAIAVLGERAFPMFKRGLSLRRNGPGGRMSMGIPVLAGWVFAAAFLFSAAVLAPRRGAKPRSPSSRPRPRAGRGRSAFAMGSCRS